MSSNFLIPLAEAGEHFHVCLRTIQRWQSLGLFPRAIILGQRKKFIPRHEIDAIFKARASGADDAEIVRLVERLHAKRAETAYLTDA